jgi:hypothetical protein
MHKIFITVRGGRPYIVDETVPDGCVVEIIDFDNIEEGDPWPSEEARIYCREKLDYPEERRRA